MAWVHAFEAWHDLVQAIGEDGAEAIQRAYAGRHLYVPKKNRLTIPGLDATVSEKLRYFYGGGRLYVPKTLRKARRNIEIIRKFRQGEGFNALSFFYALSKRQIQRIVLGA